MGGWYVAISFPISYPANAVQTVLREIEEEDSKWQEKAESASVDEKVTKTS